MPQPNDTIGPYTLIRKLGRGSFGVVWLAEKRSLVTTQVALKIAHVDDLNLDSIRKEASVWLHAGGHPNILRFIDADVYDSQPVIVSEYAADGSLTDWLNRYGGKAPSVESACRMLEGILAGLEHLHSKSIIHRDLKPDNILLNGETPRLADFGIARLLENTGAYSTLSIGTPKYMAPETYRGKRSEQTDIWSAGVIFYQMLIGSWPFEGNDAYSLMHAVFTEPPRALPGYLDHDLKAVVLKALQKDVGLRYQSALQMRQAVQRLMQTGLRPAFDESYPPQDPTLRDDVLIDDEDEQTLVRGAGNESSQKTEVKDLLRAIGMTAFIRYYDQFRDLTLSISDVAKILPQEYTLNSRRSRTSKARKIFREGLAPKALRLITEAEGVDFAIRKRAVALLREFPGEEIMHTDGEALNAVMADSNRRQFWIVLWGDPTHTAEEDEQIFNASYYDHGFPVEPKSVKVGDICFVHRIHVSKIIFVAEVMTQSKLSSVSESEKEPWRKRWIWSVKTKNLTPNYGSHWRSRGQKTFDLVKRYNALNPGTPEKISGLKFGRHVRISRRFAEFLVGDIISGEQRN